MFQQKQFGKAANKYMRVSPRSIHLLPSRAHDDIIVKEDDVIIHSCCHMTTLLLSPAMYMYVLVGLNSWLCLSNGRFSGYRTFVGGISSKKIAESSCLCLIEVNAVLFTLILITLSPTLQTLQDQSFQMGNFSIHDLR